MIFFLFFSQEFYIFIDKKSHQVIYSGASKKSINKGYELISLLFQAKVVNSSKG